MADSITFEVDAFELEKALLSLADDARPFVNEASRDTAAAVVREASARLQRQIGRSVAHPSRPDLGQGLTLAGLQSRPAYDGNGYVVVDEREPFPNVPFWLEKGTKHMKARPFFYVSMQLEIAAHERRIREALSRTLVATGLGY
jgi:hypothetical protein